MADDYSDAVDHFDREHVPGHMHGRQEIRDYLNDNFADETVPMAMKDVLADRISDRRGSGDAGRETPESDTYYDPDAGQWRDGDTGSFTKGPDS